MRRFYGAGAIIISALLLVGAGCARKPQSTTDGSGQTPPPAVNGQATRPQPAPAPSPAPGGSWALAPGTWYPTGAWATFQFSSQTAAVSEVTKLATEYRIGGADYVGTENAFELSQGQSMLMVLFWPKGQSASGGNVRVATGTGFGTATERFGCVPTPLAGASISDVERLYQAAQGQNIGTETIRVGDRSITATGYRQTISGIVTESWFSSEVPFVVVKVVQETPDRGRVTTQVIDYGTSGRQPQITAARLETACGL